MASLAPTKLPSGLRPHVRLAQVSAALDDSTRRFLSVPLLGHGASSHHLWWCVQTPKSVRACMRQSTLTLSSFVADGPSREQDVCAAPRDASDARDADGDGK